MIKNNLIYTIMNIFEKGIGFLLLPLYSIYISPVDFGAVSMVVLFLAIVSKVSTSPVVTGLIRFYYAPKIQKDTMLFLIFIYMFITIITFSIFLFLMNSYIVIYIIDNIELSSFFNLFIIVYILSSFSQILTEIYILEYKAKEITKINISKAIVIFLMTVIFLKLDYGIYSIVYGLITGLTISIILLIVNFRFKIKVSKDLFQLKEPLMYGYSLLPASIGYELIQLADRYIIKIMLGLSSVGIYVYAYTIGTLINHLLVTPNKLAMQPLLLQNESNTEKISLLLNKYSVLFFSVGLIIVLWFSAFSKEIIEIITDNKEFTDAWYIIPIVSFSYLLHGLGNYFGFGLALAKKNMIITKQTIIASSINIFFNIIFIYLWGIIGAALATLFTYVIWNYIKRTNSKKYYGIIFNMYKIHQIFILGVFSIIILYIFNIQFENHIVLLKLVFLSIITMLIYKKFIDQDDKIKIKKYVVSKFTKKRRKG